MNNLSHFRFSFRLRKRSSVEPRTTSRLCRHNPFKTHCASELFGTRPPWCIYFLSITCLQERNPFFTPSLEALKLFVMLPSLPFHCASILNYFCANYYGACKYETNKTNRRDGRVLNFKVAFTDILVTYLPSGSR